MARIEWSTTRVDWLTRQQVAAFLHQALWQVVSTNVADEETRQEILAAAGPETGFVQPQALRRLEEYQPGLAEEVLNLAETLQAKEHRRQWASLPAWVRALIQLLNYFTED